MSAKCKASDAPKMVCGEATFAAQRFFAYEEAAYLSTRVRVNRVYFCGPKRSILYCLFKNRYVMVASYCRNRLNIFWPYAFKSDIRERVVALHRTFGTGVEPMGFGSWECMTDDEFRDRYTGAWLKVAA